MLVTTLVTSEITKAAKIADQKLLTSNLSLHRDTNIKITDNALIPMKERVADVKYDPVRWLGSKIRKREGL